MELRRNYTPENLDRVRRLRRSMTKAEKCLWYSILRKRFLGYRFRRQYPVGPFVLDFYCPEKRLCIEVDGFTHEGLQDRDAARDAVVASAGIRTLRFPNWMVLEEGEEVVSQILVALGDTSPSPEGEVGSEPAAGGASPFLEGEE